MTAILFYNNAATSTSSFPTFCHNTDFILKSTISPPTSTPPHLRTQMLILIPGVGSELTLDFLDLLGYEFLKPYRTEEDLKLLPCCNKRKEGVSLQKPRV